MIGEALDRTLAAWLHEDADGRVSDHLDAVLAVTLATRQRHGQLRSGAWVSWIGRTRFLAIAAALLLAVAAMTALGIGRQRQHTAPVPTPVGDNGVMLVRVDGDIYALDAAGSIQRAIVTGPTFDFGVAFSPDGSQFAYTQMNEQFKVQVVVANADGSNLVVVFTATTVGPTGYAWSPDGRQLAILHAESSGGPTILGASVSIVEVDHPEEARDVPLPEDGDLYYGQQAFGLEIGWAGAADGELILTGGRHANEGQQAFFAIQPDGSGFREIGQPGSYEYVGLSPDGRSLTYFGYLRDGSHQAAGAQTHLVDVATGADRVFPSGHGGWDQELVFSPAGTTGAMVACLDYLDACDLIIVSLDGSAAARVIGSGVEGTPKERRFLYSPDGRKIVLSRSSNPTLVIDVETGEQTELGEGMWIEAWQSLPLP